MIMCRGRLGGFGFDVVSSWVIVGTGTPMKMARSWMWWTKGAHAKWQVHQWMNKQSMRSGQTRQTCTFANRWACQAFHHVSKEHVKDSSSEPRTIEDSAHFTMRRWSYDTHWRHPSPSSTMAQRAVQQQHACTDIVMSIHVTSCWHESCRPHFHYELNYPTIDKQAYAVYKVVKHFRPHLLKNHCIVFIPHSSVHTLLVQQELGEWCVSWMTGLQEYDLEIKPVHKIKGHGLCRLVAKAVHALENEEELAGWEQEIEMYDIRWATPTKNGTSWYAYIRQYLEHDTIHSHFSIR